LVVAAGVPADPAGGRGVRPVEKSFMIPAVTYTGAERSLYPSSFRRSVWLPCGIPGMTAGETPCWMPSRYMVAPAGVVVIVRDPEPCGAAAVLPAVTAGTLARVAMVGALVTTVTGAVVAGAAAAVVSAVVVTEAVVVVVVVVGVVVVVTTVMDAGGRAVRVLCT
jgi:hypothetical protein